MDLSKLSPAPWTPIDKRGWSGLESANGEDLVLYATCEGSWHSRVVSDDPAVIPFIALARNAFDVMIRRRWFPRFVGSKEGKQQWVAYDWNGGKNLLDTTAVWFSAGKEFPNFQSEDPFTCLVEADKWWRENVENQPHAHKPSPAD
jgi:hypothetical protein